MLLLQHIKFQVLRKEKKQLSGVEVDTSRQLSSVQIHVDCVIGGME